MQLTLFNGSPHGKKGNTEIIIKEISKGFQNSCYDKIQTKYLVQRNKIDQHIKAFENSDIVIIAFPLYIHSMPSIVKEFMEAFHNKNYSNKKMGFIVQSGFPEPNQSRYVENYLKTYPKRIGCEYLGTLIRGDSEGLKHMPKLFTKKIFKDLNNFGETLAKTQEFDNKIISKFAPWEIMPKSKARFFTFLQKLGITNMYWNTMLKKNEAFDKRFDKPYK